MSRAIIYPYKMGSQSARLLAAGLDAIRVRPEGRYLPRSEDFIVNWGSSVIPAWWPRLEGLQRLKILNKPTNIGYASNKLTAFRMLQAAGVAIPQWTTEVEVAGEWPLGYARTVLQGHSGAGIMMFPDETEYMPNAPLYTKAIENHGEYRVHVFNGTVIDYQKKRRHNGDQPTQEQRNVRNLANGWVYTRENLRHLERVEQLAIQAVAALGLDFGAVDIIKDENREVFVLEVNTACGMSDTTLQTYLTAMRNFRDNA